MDARFIGYFWKNLWHMVETKLKILSVHHPKIDDQTKMVNKSLDNLLQCLESVIIIGFDNWFFHRPNLPIIAMPIGQ